MNEFDKKIQELAEEIKTTRFKVDTALRSTVVFYAIVIIGVAAYTLYIGNRIQEYATPQAVAALLGDKVREQLPEICKTLVQQARTQAPIMATKTIDAGEKLLPQMEILAKSKIDAGVAMIIDHTVKATFPALLEQLKPSFDEISKNKSLISDKKTAEDIANILSGQIGIELDKVIDASFYTELSRFEKDIYALAGKAPHKLTQQELAEKRAIVYWLYLVEKAEPGESPLVELLRLVPEYKFE